MKLHEVLDNAGETAAMLHEGQRLAYIFGRVCAEYELLDEANMITRQWWIDATAERDEARAALAEAMTRERERGIY